MQRAAKSMSFGTRVSVDGDHGIGKLGGDTAFVKSSNSKKGDAKDTLGACLGAVVVAEGTTGRAGFKATALLRISVSITLICFVASTSLGRISNTFSHN